MTLIPKISRLTNLPSLLKHKQEAEEESRKKREQAREKHPPFNLEKESRGKLSDFSEYKIDRTANEHSNSPKSDDEHIGKKIDVTV